MIREVLMLHLTSSKLVMVMLLSDMHILEGNCWKKAETGK